MIAAVANGPLMAREARGRRKLDLVRGLLANLVLVALAGCGAPKPAPAAPQRPRGIENVAKPAGNRETVAWEADERRWMTLLLEELRRSGEQAGAPRLVELVARAEALLQQADRGELTREQLLVGLQQAERAMTDPVSDRVTEKLGDLREAMRHARVVPRRN